MSSSWIRPYTIVRTAMRPFSKVETRELEGADFLKSLYIASYSLHQKYTVSLNSNSSLKDKKAIYSLVRYGLRMSARSTPFGMFAGCGVLSSGVDRNICINVQKSRFYARLDNLILHSLIQSISHIPAIEKHLRYFPNSSIYSVHDELRYVEYELADQKRSYKASAVAKSDSLNDIINLCQPGAQHSDMIQLLVEKYAATELEAENYVEDLLINQLLVNELEPTITGEEYLPRVIRFLRRLDVSSNLAESGCSNQTVALPTVAESITEVMVLLEDLLDRLYQIQQDSTSITEQGAIIVEKLRSWVPNLMEDKLFQVDTILPDIKSVDSHPDIITGSLNDQHRTLSKVIDVLNKLTPFVAHSSLSKLSNQFYQRFGNQEIPLAKVLDADVGINYLEQPEQILSPTLEEITLPLSPKDSILTWNRHQTWKWNLLQDTLRQQQYMVEITDDMFQEFTSSEEDLPPSMSVMCRKVEGGKIYLDSVGGVSATNLLNRFAHADPAIHRIVKDICDQEQQYNPDVIFAEIVHLPDSRVGNVVFHPHNRAYEIPYLAISSVDTDHQLPLSDLYVSVVRGQVILRSRKLGKRIIPRLSTAHNYRFSELPIYRFLCDLQTQGLRSNLSFHWGEPFGRFKFVPRVMYQNVILRPATWYLEETDLLSLKMAKQPSDFLSAYQSFCKHWNLPRRWVHAHGDNELLVDSKQPLTIEAWWDLVKNRNLVTIKEFFAPAEGAVIDEQGETHAHQLVATWIKQKPTYQNVSPRSIGSSSVIRTFAPGSEWVYYKLYSSEASQDRLLEESIWPLMQRWQEEQTIAQWFFIRYADPDSHLRIRFRLADNLRLIEIMQQFSTALSDFLASGLLIRLQLDTYQRELERYGGEAIRQAEVLFHYDSETTVRFLTLTEGDEREDLRWLWALRSIDELLNDFQLATPEKLALLQRMKDSFAREFRMDKSLKLQLDKKYRTHRSAINDMLTLQDTNDDLYPLVGILQNRSTRHASAVTTLLEAHRTDKLLLPLSDLLQSYVHMLVNRLMPSQARFHELVLYDFLYREYRSELARTKR